MGCWTPYSLLVRQGAVVIALVPDTGHPPNFLKLTRD